MIYNISKICLSETAPEQAKYAAKELRFYLSRMTGKSFQIESIADENSVILNQIENSDLGEDGFSITPYGVSVCINGGKRGIIYGAYEFLERLGCRFFTPECEKVPNLKKVEFNLDEEIKQKPVLEYREHDYIDLVRSVRFAVKSRLNGNCHPIPEKLGGNMSYEWFVHTFQKMVPPEIYGETHPEFYALQADGTRPQTPLEFQLCLTEPGVLEASIKSVREALRSNPSARIISISQNDCANNNCQCERCRAIDKEEGSPAGNLIRFVNAIAERLENEFPNVIFDTLAYNHNRIAPCITRPRHNVCVRLCTIEACFAHSLETCDDENCYISRPDGTRSRIIDDLISWGNVCNRMYIWDYTTNFANYAAPHPNWNVLQPNLKTFIRNGAKGVFEQANGSAGGGADMNELRAYVISKLLWDADTDVNYHIKEFTDYYYGAAAPFVREYIKTICKKAELDNIHILYNSQLESELYSEEMLDIYDALLNSAENAVKDNALYCRRIQKIKLCTRWVRLKRAGMFCGEHNAEEINEFFADWNSFGLINIDERFSVNISLRALLDDNWFGGVYFSNFYEWGEESAIM